MIFWEIMKTTAIYYIFNYTSLRKSLLLRFSVPVNNTATFGAGYLLVKPFSGEDNCDVFVVFLKKEEKLLPLLLGLEC